MPRYRKNSEWQRRTGGMYTDHGLVAKAINDSDAFKKLMTKYKHATLDYLEHILARDKALTLAQVFATVTPVWREIERAMADKLAQVWASGLHSFRDLLLEVAHESLFLWSKPEMRRLMAWEPGREERSFWEHGMRDVILETAWDRLATYQQEGGNQYHTILQLRKENPSESDDALAAKLPGRPGGKRLDSARFRKGLERARDLFGRYLCEEVEAGYPESADVDAEELRRAFIELDLMDYAESSKYCRSRLELGAASGL